MIGENVEFKDYCDVTFTSKVVGIFSDKYEDVKFMDGLLMYERDGRVLFASQHGGIVEVDEALMGYAR